MTCMSSDQLSLFDCVKDVYAEATGPIGNEILYRRVGKKAGLSLAEMNAKTPIGRAGVPRSKLQREVRWHQQTLKQLGLIKPAGERGSWELTGAGKIRLRKIRPKASLLAFSTRLGAGIWSLCDDVFKSLDAPIT